MVLGRAADGGEGVLAIGEAKWDDVMGLGHLDRLRRVRDLLAARGGPARTPGSGAAAGPRLMCCSGAGFTPQLRAVAASDPMVQLIGPRRLHHGD